MTKELILLGIYILLLVYLLVMRRTQLLKVAALALAFGLIWTLLVRDEYSYNVATITIMDVNLYALLGWSLGLLIGYILYMGAQRTLQLKKWWHKLLLFNGIYLPLLIVVETISYHTLNVVNVATASYIGLPLCDCLHAPIWMQTAYLSMGSIFIILILALDTWRTATTTPDTAVITQPQPANDAGSAA